MPYLHLPVQSGSDPILHAMNRGHSARDYLNAVDRIRAARPDIALSSDFIVGFPGESDADFGATMELVREVGYAQAYSFKYSPRPGTPAAEQAEQIDEDVKSERLAALQSLLKEQQSAFNANCLGHNMEVLLDRPGRKPGQLIGRSPFLQAVHVDSADTLIGELVDVEISDVGANSMTGRLTTLPAYGDITRQSEELAI